MLALRCALLLVAFSIAPAFAAPTPPPPKRIPGGVISAQVLPAPAYIERAGGAQLLNCDLKITNATGVAWKLIELEVAVLDRAGVPVWRKLITDGGVSPAMGVI